METCVVSALDKPAAELTVMDVYDVAAVLGREFERVIDRFGCESLVGVVPRVVRVLELLETLVSRGAAGQEAEELRRELDRLRQERSDRYEQDRKHQKELELVEDVWRGEVQDLLSQITELQAENKRLLLSLSLKESPITEEDLQKHEGMSEKERQVMTKLKDLVDKQRDEIRAKEHELTLRNEDIEALQMQQQRLIRINQDLLHRTGVMEAQGKTLIQQRAELEAAAQARQQELGALQLELTRLRKELREWELEREVTEIQEFPLSGCRMSSPPSPQMTKRSTDTEPEEEETDGLEQESDKPRFTLQELRDVLQERNELKAQVFMLQEELVYYKNEEFEDHVYPIVRTPSPPPCLASADQPESGIRRLIFTAIMPMVAAGLITDDPTLLPIRRLISFL
ncbi:RILP-like protein 1 isoform X2 [Brachyistius frenatus]|uniref:RILP-like protein 1 isoform X2 n=1 Tax=Brachyistius frenatus TaxID=100188 RepID=UPI0037E9AFB2